LLPLQKSVPHLLDHALLGSKLVLQLSYIWQRLLHIFVTNITFVLQHLKGVMHGLLLVKDCIKVLLKKIQKRYKTLKLNNVSCIDLINLLTQLRHGIILIENVKITIAIFFIEEKANKDIYFLTLIINPYAEIVATAFDLSN
jgi:hypothetical protein